MKPYYYVFNRTIWQPPFVKHDTISKAQDEAERSAQKQPGDSFEIVKVIGVAQVQKPAVTFWCDGVWPEDEP